MKNKKYQKLAAILVMMAMSTEAVTAAAAETTVAADNVADETAETNDEAENDTTADVETGSDSTADAEAETDDTAGADTDTEAAADTAAEETLATPLEKTDIFAQQKEIDAALLQEAESGYSLEDALIVVNPYGNSPLTAVAVFSTEEACGGTVTVKGKSSENDITGTFEAEKNHIVPIYGLYNGDTTEVEITLDDGTSATFEVTTENINVNYGDIQADMIKEENYDYSNLTFVCCTMGSLYALDAAGDIRFYTTMGGSLGVHELENGHLLMPASYVLKTSYYKEGMIEVDLTGKIYREYMIPGGQHHDFAELPNGNFLVASDSPDLSTVEDYVVEIDRETGDVVWELDMKDLIGIEDGQSASMDTDGSEESDWFHNNGLCYDANNDLVLLSARHKDAIVAVKKETKELAWILGDPTGWEEVDSSYFFTPEGDDFEWFYAQHNVSLLDNGDIALFDNGTAKVKRVDGDDRVTGDDVYSRAVVYHIDTDDMTVSQEFEYGKERGADWYADWISGVQSLDGTQDHLLIAAGSHLHSEEENRSDYYPKDMFVPGLIKATHIDQVDDGELSFELTISGDTYNALTFRAFRMPLYTNGKYDVEAVPEVLGSLGETSYEELGLDLSDAQDLDAGWNIILDESKVSVNGLFQTDTAPEDLETGYLILDSEEMQRAYQLTQSAVAGEDGTSVTAKGWASVDGLEDADWDIYLELDGEIYNTHMMLAAQETDDEETEAAEVTDSEEADAAEIADSEEVEAAEITDSEEEEAATTDSEDVEAEDSTDDAKKNSTAELDPVIYESKGSRYTEEEKSQKCYGYYGQAIETSMDLDDTISIQENDDSATEIETTIPRELTLVASSHEIDRQLQAEQDNGYTWEEPIAILNPYQISPLTAVVLFDTEESCGVRFTVKGKTEAADISGEVAAATSHRVPIIGLYPAMDNTVVLELLDEDGNVTDFQEITITTEALPDKLTDVIEPEVVSGESAYDLTMVYGQNTTMPFAYDCMGDVRWYMTKETGNYGLYMLSNCRMIWQDTGAYVPCMEKPQSTNLYEIDYLGRAYNLYYLSGGSHHEVIEKEPGGNLLVLTSSIQTHYEDKIEEIDRQTGEVVNELKLQDIMDSDYVNMIDWAHMNTVSYQPDGDTIIISARNLESVIKLNWTTKEIQWILADPRFWEGTEYEQYVLQPEGDFVYHFQQHTAYQLDVDLDGNDQTIELSMFDNHYVSHREDTVTYSDNSGESYLLVYSIDEKNKTVKQIKKIPMVISWVTSAAIYDEESGHFFGMCGFRPKEESKRRGMTYEFDYETEELLNQFSIRTTFYRAEEMKIDYDDLASPMVLDENYIKGELWQPVKVTDGQEYPETDQVLEAEDVTFNLIGQVMYIGTLDHQISQVIFKGKDSTYVYDTTSIRQHKKNYLKIYEHLPVPLQGLDADDYEVYIMYQDGLYDTQQSITIKG